MQMLLSIYIVFSLGKEGYFNAVLLNIINILTTILYMRKSGSTDAMPGVISNISTLIIISLISQYKKQVSDYAEHINNQKSELEKSQENLYKQAHIDSLTGLPNRYAFIKELDRAINDAKLHNTKLGVIFADLDSFKRINDTLGHSAGDDVLITISNRLISSLDDNYTVARFGGDEFIILRRNLENISDIEKDVLTILNEFKKPLKIDGLDFYISGSVGIAMYPIDGECKTDIIKNADISMYEAKKNGKNQYVFFNPKMKTDTYRKTELINYLHSAIEEDEFYLHYQPQVNLTTGEIIGVEALLRWDNSKYGLVSPGEFIPLATKAGLMNSIGLWVFKNACKDYKELTNIYKNNIKLAINFSLEQLINKNNIKNLISILEETKVEAKNIEIEITESLVYVDESKIREILDILKDIGFSIAIDDYGKEYSSLNRIRKFPIDLIKIDMEFIHGITNSDGKDKAIVRSIISLSKGLGIHVLAEGVETKEQLEFLKEEGCYQVQGYYYYKPMGIEDIKAE
ncbi:MAG: EAL domain-containing protein [Epulopiscium sp.]|nr:EAL domain-containing protein [Candidatus Epulonipiscium sp.]